VGGGRVETVRRSAVALAGQDDHAHDTGRSVEVARGVVPARPAAPVVVVPSPMHEELGRPLVVAPPAMDALTGSSDGAIPDDRPLTWWQRLRAWVRSDA
jgi:hypothetical protein